jgi:hypothetical protein
MSGQEKSAQIGDAILLCEEQKKELAHLTEKIAKVRKAYRTFASEEERWRVDTSRPEKVFLLHPAPEERDLASHLLAQPQLAELITERHNAEAALAQTRAKLAGFGVTSC